MKKYFPSRFIKTARNFRAFAKSQSLESKLGRSASQILPRVNCIDVGASYYPHPAWELFRLSPQTHWIAVEPNQQNLNYLSEATWPCQVTPVPEALSERGGTTKLYITNVDSGSSILEPAIPEWKKHRFDLEYFYPMQERMIETCSLASVLHRYAPIDPLLIKLDTQGSELAILRGVPAELFHDRLMCIELECTLQNEPIMKDAAHFSEVLSSMEQLGLELVCLKPIQGLLPNYSAKLKGKQVLNECDAVFMLTPDRASKLGAPFLSILVAAQIAYGLYGEAKHNTEMLVKSNPEDNQYRNLLSILAE